jgi:maleate isomerase
MRALGMRRIAVVSPFQEASNELERAYLTALGFEVLHDVALGVPEGEQTIAIPPARWIEAAKAAMRADADGYFLSGSNTTIMESIPMIEAVVGKPAVSSTQATLWAAIRHLKPKLGAVSVSRPLGRLCELL